MYCLGYWNGSSFMASVSMYTKEQSNMISAMNTSDLSVMGVY